MCVFFLLASNISVISCFVHRQYNGTDTKIHTHRGTEAQSQYHTRAHLFLSIPINDCANASMHTHARTSPRTLEQICIVSTCINLIHLYLKQLNGTTIE